MRNYQVIPDGHSGQDLTLQIPKLWAEKFNSPAGYLESPSTPIDPVQPSFQRYRALCWHGSRTQEFLTTSSVVQGIAIFARTQPFPPAPTYQSESTCTLLSTRAFKTGKLIVQLLFRPCLGVLASLRGRSQLPRSSRFSPPHKNEHSTWISNVLKKYWGKLIGLNIILSILIPGHVG